MNSDAGMCSVLVLLDLSAAFDTIENKILLERLKHWVGRLGTLVLIILSNRKSSISIFMSFFCPTEYGVP